MIIAIDAYKFVKNEYISIELNRFKVKSSLTQKKKTVLSNEIFICLCIFMSKGYPLGLH